MKVKTVLFTGAGASYAIGYSLTSELLPKTRVELKTSELFHGMNSLAEDEADRRELRRFLIGLFPGFEKIDAEKLPLITDVFSLVEYAIQANEALPIGGDHVLRRCRDLLKQAITDILLGEYLASLKRTGRRKGPGELLLDKLQEWIHDRYGSISLVTTNYDIGIETQLYKLEKKKNLHKSVDLGFDWRSVDEDQERTRPKKPSLRVLKLHGSLDTLRCPICGYIYFNPWGSIAHQAFRKTIDSGNTCECSDEIKLELHIVSPSFVRDIRDANLLCVWRSAMETLRRAEEWIVVGYSLPPEDLAIRSLFIRAYAAATKKPKITVVQKGDAERSRYELLFPVSKFYTGGLEEFLAETGE